MAYSWRDMSNAEIRAAHAEAKRLGRTAEARSAYSALYRRGERVGRRSGGAGADKPTRGALGGGLEAALRRIESLDGTQMTVGWQGTEHVAPGDSPGEAILLRAAVVEFGTEDGRIPSRPALRTSLQEHGRKWSRGMGDAVKARARGGSGERELRLVGVVAVGDVQETITDGPWEPNAPSTIAAKTRQGRKDQPWIDTGQTRQSVRASVDLPGRDPEVIG